MCTCVCMCIHFFHGLTTCQCPMSILFEEYDIVLQILKMNNTIRGRRKCDSFKCICVCVYMCIVYCIRVIVYVCICVYRMLPSNLIYILNSMIDESVVSRQDWSYCTVTCFTLCHAPHGLVLNRTITKYKYK